MLQGTAQIDGYGKHEVILLSEAGKALNLGIVTPPPRDQRYSFVVQLGKTSEQLSVADNLGSIQILFMLAWRGISAIFYATFLCLSSHLVQAWDYERHRLINDLALDTLPQSFPQFVLTAENRERIRFLAGEPDRWRNTRDRALRLSLIHI